MLSPKTYDIKKDKLYFNTRNTKKIENVKMEILRKKTKKMEIFKILKLKNYFFKHK